VTDAPAAAASLHAVSWHEIHGDACALARALATRGPWQGLIAISRGGLAPAAIVARVLDIRLVETLCLASYVGAHKRDLEVLKGAPATVGGGAGWLVVDDLVDSGTTAAAARRMLPDAHIATLYVKPAGRHLADSFVREIPADLWIDFPWDRDPALP